ncbi:MULTISPECIES: DUF4160 domain-containing protein [Rhizobium/Agrobacterium group]|uniref:Uncharacterized protein n=7 Tax=Rhizobium/Agrobacterium group TaxID=227290 RepID=A0A2Z2PTS0_RHIRH|nr:MULTISPECIES: DUF4160 domain-containing protein [Rhizobium/Agrobacterium group]KJF70127.1 hypothetical protein RP75_27990 [Agrobacterium arsenijevicii]OCJ08443.1 hypothetical protein A6U88_25445 [Agrobacterium sp. B131/95]ASK43662.1 hypothetical protein [Agrobacterium radiobacter]ASK44006.1 hypothetical protein [Rhizobium rhizogenes]ASK44289.1 hypothetical protein [Rhizobium rhizogenes]
MILFHHTSVSLAEGILASQLNQGHVTRRSGEPLRDVVWLTTDERHEGHGLTTGEQLDPVHRSYVEKVEQTKLRQGRVWTADKTRIRIKVKIPTRDRKLFNYSAWSRKNDGPRFAKFMGLSCVESVAGLNASELERVMLMTATKEETWYLSFRPIDPKEFEEVLYRTEDGYIPYDFELHGRHELENVGIYSAGKAALEELREVVASRHGYDRASAVVTCADLAMPANVVVRGGGINVAFNLDTLRRLEGSAGPYEEEIVAWIERHRLDLNEAWQKSRTQLISYS